MLDVEAAFERWGHETRWVSMIQEKKNKRIVSPLQAGSIKINTAHEDTVVVVLMLLP
jgi:hypothetical protein